MQGLCSLNSSTCLPLRKHNKQSDPAALEPNTDVAQVQKTLQ